ncbi:hypothetical protein OAN307_c18330 [Octadecabacter antarcticus 307]|uniref:Uncharacterized protein n=1 Tax=Octadecabacter antarcticus 307 TaxID=391626 RepID=M9R4G5_9RHOB|nr:hypothetical protein OAN307_c18330 [Octadecabacter antarcticus 307]
MLSSLLSAFAGIGVLGAVVAICRRNVGKEPNLTNAARCTSVRYHESDQKPSTTTWVLNGFFGGVKRDGLSMCQKGAFLAYFWMVISFGTSCYANGPPE